MFGILQPARSRLIRRLPLLRPARALVAQTAALSTKPGPEPASAEAVAESADSEISTPWYLRNDLKSELIENAVVEIPRVPETAPPHVAEILRLLAEGYGMEKLLLFDMTTLDETHEFRSDNQNTDYIIICTGKSERHIYKAASELRNYIKHVYGVIPAVEGMVLGAKTPAMRRRLLRRARKGPVATDNEYGRSANSWVLFHHDLVSVHILTGPRREELNLESLWCPEHERHLYEPQPAAPQESDHIFSGVRRLHTWALRRLYSTPASVHGEMLQLNQDAPDSQIEELRLRFEAACGPHVDHAARFEFFKTLHQARPHLVSFAEVEDILLEKYASAFAFSEHAAAQKAEDVTEYAKLLIDSPETRVSDKASLDRALDKLSRFISNLYKFSDDQFSMTANEQFIPLLWRLALCNSDLGITPKMVDNALESGSLPASQPAEPLHIASNNGRNVVTLVDWHAKANGTTLFPRFLELVLFSFGNAGNWSAFWKQWEHMQIAQTLSALDALAQWVRMVVFLLLCDNQAQNLHFLRNYWKHSSCFGGSFMTRHLKNDDCFNSPNEKEALSAAIERIISSFGQDETAFQGIRGDLRAMQ